MIDNKKKEERFEWQNKSALDILNHLNLLDTQFWYFCCREFATTTAPRLCSVTYNFDLLACDDSPESDSYEIIIKSWFFFVLNFCFRNLFIFLFEFLCEFVCYVFFSLVIFDSVHSNDLNWLVGIFFDGTNEN